jgi:multidrug efflux pump subunit AcrA (membrane-fusion protein)
MKRSPASLSGRIRAILLGVLALLLGMVAWLGAMRRLPGMSGNGARPVASAPVIKGDFEVTLKTRGEVKALRSVTLSAPASVTEVKLVKLSANGSKVSAGDVVVEIDATSERDRLAEQQSSVRQVDAEIEKVRAQARIQDEQDRLDLAQAQFAVESAKLELRKQEIVSAIEAGKAKLALETAERKLQEVEERMSAHKRAQAADLDQAMQKRKKASNDVDLADRNIQRLTIKSPIAGILNVLPNWRAGGFGMGQAPEFKAGDRAWPGAALVEIPDLTSLVIELNIEETDRGRVAAEQPAAVKVDAVSDKPMRGKIQAISTLSQASFVTWPPVKTFRATVTLDSLDPKLRPGMSAGADLTVDRLTGVVLIPARAVFDQGGKVLAYVKKGRTWEPREITTGEKNETQVVVREGLQPGETVALEDPAAGGPPKPAAKGKT